MCRHFAGPDRAVRQLRRERAISESSEPRIGRRIGAAQVAMGQRENADQYDVPDPARGDKSSAG